MLYVTFTNFGCDCAILMNFFLFQMFFWDSLTQKTLETKKNHRSRTNTAKVSEGHVQHHVTLSFKVIRKGHAFVTSWNGSPDPKNIRNKKIHRSRTNTAKVSKGHVQHHVTLSFKVIRGGHVFVTSWNGFPDP